jgi:hypothetical protein
VADQRCERDLGEAEIVGDAGEAVAQDVRRNVGQRRVLEDLLPMIREAAEGVVLSLAREDIGARQALAALLEILDDGKPDGADDRSERPRS